MDKSRLFQNVTSGSSVLILPASLLIKEEEKDLEEKLRSLGARIESGSYSIRSVKDVTIGQSFIGSVNDWMQTAVILPKTDNQPLYVVLKNVDNIILHVVSEGNNLTCILWKNGGSTCVDAKYFFSLKKYWLKKRGLSVVLDFSKDQEKIINGLSEIAGFKELYSEYLEIKATKEGYVRKQDYTNAAKKRDEENIILEKINSDINILNFLLDFASKDFEESLT